MASKKLTSTNIPVSDPNCDAAVATKLLELLKNDATKLMNELQKNRGLELSFAFGYDGATREWSLQKFNVSENVLAFIRR